MKTRRPWTDADQREAEAMRAGGKSLDAISRAMKRGKETVRLRLGGTRRSGPVDRNHAWPPEKVAILRQHVADGLSAGQSGRILGLTRNTVMGKAARLGLRFGSAPAARPSTPRERITGYSHRADPRPRPPKEAKPRKAKNAGALRIKERDARIKAGKEAIAKGQVPQPWRTVREIPDGIALNPKPLTERTFGQCAFIVSADGEDPVMCCNPAHGSWCDGHRAYVFSGTEWVAEADKFVRRAA